MAPSAHAIRGAPCWVSLMTRDLTTAEAFYQAVLGWEYRPGFQPDYSLALVNGVPVAGIGALSTAMGSPISWTSYFAVDSADQAADRIRERGATVGVGPLKFGKSRVAWAVDPAGAVFGLWEGEIHPDWRVGRTNGAPAWLELRTRDAFASAIFYGEVFQWKTDDPEQYDVRYEHDRVILRIAGRSVAGLIGGGIEAAPEPQFRPQWHVYFCVPDVEKAVQRAQAAGGTVTAPPAGSPFGPVAMLRDPDGGLFTVTSGSI
jgi:predicted enzyme related to lactoylglutathione lyase